MKKVITILSLSFLFFLTACSGAPTGMYEVSMDNRLFVVDFDENVISYGGQNFRFETDGRGIMITFPDGTSVWEREEDGVIISGGTLDMLQSPIGWDLIAVLNQARQNSTRTSSGESIWTGLITIPFGLFLAASPQSAWQLTHGWRFKNAEPSNLVLIYNRIIGVILLLIGLLLLFI